jgi:hypothetical protein
VKIEFFKGNFRGWGLSKGGTFHGGIFRGSIFHGRGGDFTALSEKLSEI